jgi:c-di-GMP-binding flagellar brake protein YcgR
MSIQVQPRIHCTIFAITNEARTELFEFASTYVGIVEVMNKFYLEDEDKVIVKIGVDEREDFGHCRTYEQLHRINHVK